MWTIGYPGDYPVASNDTGGCITNLCSILEFGAEDSDILCSVKMQQCCNLGALLPQLISWHCGQLLPNSMLALAVELK